MFLGNVGPPNFLSSGNSLSWLMNSSRAVTSEVTSEVTIEVTDTLTSELKVNIFEI